MLYIVMGIGLLMAACGESVHQAPLDAVVTGGGIQAYKVTGTSTALTPVIHRDIVFKVADKDENPISDVEVELYANSLSQASLTDRNGVPLGSPGSPSLFAFYGSTPPPTSTRVRTDYFRTTTSDQGLVIVSLFAEFPECDLGTPGDPTATPPVVAVPGEDQVVPATLSVRVGVSGAQFQITATVEKCKP